MFEHHRERSVQELLELIIALIIERTTPHMADTTALTAAVASLSATVPEVVTEFGVLSAPDASQPDIDAATAAVVSAAQTLVGLLPVPAPVEEPPVTA